MVANVLDLEKILACRKGELVFRNKAVHEMSIKEIESLIRKHKREELLEKMQELAEEYEQLESELIKI